METQADSSTVPINLPAPIEMNTPPLFTSSPGSEPTPPTSVDAGLHCLPCTDLTQLQVPVIEFGTAGGLPPRSVKIFAESSDRSVSVGDRFFIEVVVQALELQWLQAILLTISTIQKSGILRLVVR